MTLRLEIGKRLACLTLVTSLITACGNDEDFGFGGIYFAGQQPGPSDPAATSYSGSGALAVAGGTLEAGDVDITIPENGAIDSIDISVSETTLPASLPSGFAQIEQVLNVSISATDQDKLNSPLTISMTYGDGSVTDEGKLLLLHHDATQGYEAVRIVSQNTFSNTITFESRVFSDFVLVEVNEALAASFDTGFSPNTSGWNITNSGSYFAPDGNAFGMSGFAAWYYTRNGDGLSTKFTTDVSLLVATRAQISQNKAWPSRTWRNAQDLSSDRLGWLMKAYISLLDEPLVLMFGSSSSIKQAAVVYGYDATGFKFYDVDVMGLEQTVSFDGSSFGSYETHDGYGYAAITTLGRSADLSDLTTEGENGFPGSNDVNVTAPTNDQQIADHKTDLQGTLVGSLSSETDLYVEVKGVGRQVAVAGAAFDSEIEISSGTNTIVLLPGVDSSAKSNWFKGAPTHIVEADGTLPASELIVTLTWEQNEIDVDLYITEPNNGETMWFSSKTTANGLTLDIDDTNGYGPEHGTLTTTESTGTTTGTIVPGEYVVRVHYYSDDDLAVAATGNVSIVVNEGAAEQESAEFEYTIATDNSGEAGPGSAGDSWVDIAYVDIVNSIITPITPPVTGSTP